MNLEHWTAVDRYLTDLLVPTDSVLENALRTSARAGLPSIQVAPNQGKLLQLLATGKRGLARARRRGQHDDEAAAADLDHIRLYSMF